MRALLQSLSRQISLIAGRGRLTGLDDSQDLQRMQAELLPGELRELVRMQNYGLSSNPKDGAQLLTLSLKGLRQNSVVIACDDGRYRIKDLKRGEVAIYTDEGDVIHFKRGRIIHITTHHLEADCKTATITATETAALSAGDASIALGGGEVALTAATIKLNGDVIASGDVVAGGISLQEHEHPNGTDGSPTGAPTP